MNQCDVLLYGTVTSNFGLKNGEVHRNVKWEKWDAACNWWIQIQNDVSQYFQEIQSKLNWSQITKGQRRIVKKDTSFMLSITMIGQMRLV